MMKKMYELTQKRVCEIVLLFEYNNISDVLEDLDDQTMSELLDRQGDLAEKIEAEDGWDMDRTLDIAVDALVCLRKPVKVLSGGERRRVAL